MSEIERLGEKKVEGGREERRGGKWGKGMFYGFGRHCSVGEVELVQRGHVEWKKTKTEPWEH